jgi:hypothetical protein
MTSADEELIHQSKQDMTLGIWMMHGKSHLPGHGGSQSPDIWKMPGEIVSTK